ncbi:DUF1707 domain-containing protein [Amycolatopsis acidiphila]|uniref:DUF1707 domain-containing protein n=1 Tax=Amycolatopsis acidiphila TaxID=715473 RepID=A0A557ZYC0_9PSEU|nr:DUF1707 domain-containing protein [Amycolatopsis acidiphila]TVT17006.1 DUF1707 domain-containing protein [Amycolatopsis acidiphila]UIJ63738.1 DUF1707 domain-containing protein [Amycolatopsis acidiphila]
MRLSDAERNEAIEALSEHVRTGRLDIDEYGTRSARVTAATKRSELAPLFEDLPEPRPSVLRARPVAPARPAAPPRRFGVGAVPIAAIVAVLLFLTVARGLWFVFLLPVVVALIFGARSR